MHTHTCASRVFYVWPFVERAYTSTNCSQQFALHIISLLPCKVFGLFAVLFVVGFDCSSRSWTRADDMASECTKWKPQILDNTASTHQAQKILSIAIAFLHKYFFVVANYLRLALNIDIVARANMCILHVLEHRLLNSPCNFHLSSAGGKISGTWVVSEDLLKFHFKMFHRREEGLNKQLPGCCHADFQNLKRLRFLK